MNLKCFANCSEVLGTGRDMERFITRRSPEATHPSSVPWMHGTQTGLSLADVTIALAVTAIVLTLGIPSFSQIIDQTRLQSTADRLARDLALARSAAIRGSTPVVMCSSNDGRSCSGEKDWGNGWIIFEDANGDSAPSTRTDPAIIQVTGSPAEGIVIGGNHAYFRYLPDGSMPPQ